MSVIAAIIISNILSIAGVFWIISKARKEWYSGSLLRLKVTESTKINASSNFTPDIKRANPLIRRGILIFTFLVAIYNIVSLAGSLLGPEPFTKYDVLLAVYVGSYVTFIAIAFLFSNFMLKTVDLFFMINELLRQHEADIKDLRTNIIQEPAKSK